MEKNNYKTILLEMEHSVAKIIFNRTEVHNAFNSVLLTELDDALEEVKNDKSIRIVILTGKGKSFCAGADLNWMKEIINYTFKENLKESFHIAEIMHKIYSIPKPTIAMVNGAAIGGGTGFVSACDIVVASERAKFSLSEVKIGLVPAAISPYVIRKIGENKAREYFLTGVRITAEKACDLGLVNQVVPHEELSQKVDEIVSLLMDSGPEAVANCKELIMNVPRLDWDEVKDFTANMIANLRVSDEGQEGMTAFLEKRKPVWAKGDKQNRSQSSNKANSE